MKNVTRLFIDFVKAVMLGSVISALLSGMLFLGGFLAGGFSGKNGLEAGKDGLLLVASLGIFLLAGMLISKGKKPEQFTELNGLRKHFNIIGYKTVLGIICAMLIVAASLLDAML